MKGFFRKLFGGDSVKETPKKRGQADTLNPASPQPATSNNDLKPGDFIAGEYRVRRVFGGEGDAGGKGKSGMGVVYLVEARSSEAPFVLKTFQRKAANLTLIARFKAEAENLDQYWETPECRPVPLDS